jgi:hypothetical protein
MRSVFANQTLTTPASRALFILKRSIVYFPYMAAKKTTLNELGDMLTHVVKHMATKDDLADLRNEMHDGFASINRRLDQIIQTQLDEHATRIKKLETAVFSK